MNKRIDRFPFRLGTTSYIYPDHPVPNVRKLAGLVDDIELLLFESDREDNFPSKKSVTELRKIADDYNMSYTIHFPIDRYLASPEHEIRLEAAETFNKVIDITSPLSPYAYNLHLESSPDRTIPPENEFLAFAEEGLNLIDFGQVLPEKLALENLSYDFGMTSSLIEKYNLSICIDVGHLIIYGFDPLEHIRKHADRTKVMHWHGVENSNDHKALPTPPDQLWEEIFSLTYDLNYQNVITLEIFSLKNLTASLKAIDMLYMKQTSGKHVNLEE